MSDLENDFEETAKKINEEIKKAADAMSAANKLAEEAGLQCLGGNQYVLEDLSKEELKKIALIDFGPLFLEMRMAGWSTSSLQC